MEARTLENNLHNHWQVLGGDGGHLYKIINLGESPQNDIICPFCRYETSLSDKAVNSLPDDHNIVATLSLGCLGTWDWCTSVHARCTHLDARRSVHAPRRFDARCTHLDARRFGARPSVHRRSVHALRRSTLRRSALGASTLGARTSTLDRSTLGARTSTLRRSVHAPRRFGASTLGARTSTPRRSTPRRSVHAYRRSVLTPRRSTLQCIDARCTHLDARRFGARRSVHASRRSTHAPRRFGA
ncbi:UNVERIFIED_CONTAM: hypothetical protein FKN15_009495 [Acipenser sinensis]